MSNEPKDTAQKPTLNESEVTSTGMPWSEVGDFALPYAEWLDGRHGPAEDALPSLDQVPIPPCFLLVPFCTRTVPVDQKRWPTFMVPSNALRIAGQALGY